MIASNHCFRLEVEIVSVAFRVIIGFVVDAFFTVVEELSSSQLGIFPHALSLVEFAFLAVAAYTAAVALLLHLQLYYLLFQPALLFRLSLQLSDLILRCLSPRLQLADLTVQLADLCFILLLLLLLRLLLRLIAALQQQLQLLLALLSRHHLVAVCQQTWPLSCQQADRVVKRSVDNRQWTVDSGQWVAG